MSGFEWGNLQSCRFRNVAIWMAEIGQTGCMWRMRGKAVAAFDRGDEQSRESSLTQLMSKPGQQAVPGGSLDFKAAVRISY